VTSPVDRLLLAIPVNVHQVVADFMGSPADDLQRAMRQYVQTGLEVHRQVATTLAELILGGLLSSPAAESRTGDHNGQDVA
jgi:hypothetical protein